MSIRIVKLRLTIRRLILLDVIAGTTSTSAAFWLLLAYTVDAGSGIDVVIDGPVRALAAVRQRTRNLLETRVQREVVSDRVLWSTALAVSQRRVTKK